VVRGVSYLLYDYKVGDKVVVDVDPREHNTTPHRRFHGKIGVIEEVGIKLLAGPPSMSRLATPPPPQPPSSSSPPPPPPPPAEEGVTNK
jgi:hypothetical protein